MDAARGFFLNGISYPLRGVVLWRDQAFSGPVFNEEELRRDMRLIREMGANAVRVAGGTHHPAFYELCDEEGVVVLADGPFAGTSTLDERGYFATPAFRDNAERQFREAGLPAVQQSVGGIFGEYSQTRRYLAMTPFPLSGR